MEEGRLPFILLPLRFIAVTLDPVTVIPYQVLTGPVNQLVLSRHSEPFVLLYKSTKASESVVLTACARNYVDIIVELKIQQRRRIFVFIV